MRVSPAPSDEALLDRFQHAAFDYFLQQYNPVNGLIADTSRAGSPCSIAVVGFDMNLEAAGVRYDTVTGVFVNDFLQTTNRRIYAAGDVCLEHKFAHVADASARIVVQNAFFMGRKRLSSLIIPWSTYTDPEIAHIGLYVREAQAQNIPVKTFTILMHDVDRAITDGEEEGFVKIHLREGTDKILGATVVARHAGEMITGLSLAITSGIGLREMARVIHAYPTQVEAIKMAAVAYNLTRVSPFLKALSKCWLTC